MSLVMRLRGRLAAVQPEVTHPHALLPALDTLSVLMDHTTAEQRRRLSPRQVCGMAQAVRVFPEDTASEVAHEFTRVRVWCPPPGSREPPL